MGSGVAALPDDTHDPNAEWHRNAKQRLGTIMTGQTIGPALVQADALSVAAECDGPKWFHCTVWPDDDGEEDDGKTVRMSLA